MVKNYEKEKPAIIVPYFGAIIKAQTKKEVTAVLVLVIVIVALAAYFYTRRGQQPFDFEGTAAAQAVLKKRFASGDIDEETYLNMLRVLKNK